MPAHSPVTPLTDDEAWSRLAGAEVGRLATVMAGEPDIVPVNFVVDGRTIVFRTAEGSKLLSLTVHPAVAFEADGWDAAGGWSVVAKGTAAEVTGSERDRLETLPLRPFVPTVKVHYIRIEVESISGREFAFGPEPDPEFGLQA